MTPDPFYNSRTWKRLRQEALLRDYRCAVPGCRATATIVDHIVSRRAGGPDELANLRCLCATHDNQTKEDSTGKRRGADHYIVGCDANGHPRDPAHWWNQK